MKATRWLVLAVVLAGLAVACSGDPPDASRPAVRGVLLLTLDTTRADRIGAYGYAAARTPTLDRLAREGIVFERAFAPTPVTLPSHASILTGVYPPAHGIRDNRVFALREEARLVSEVLRERGWRTGAFVGAYVLASRFGLDQGFERYAGGRGGGVEVAERPANEVMGDAIDWLASLDPEDRFFLWVHFYDPHVPYQAHGTRADTPSAAYDAEIAFCDTQIARLLQFMEGRELGKDLLIAVTADHGEAFGEHGERTHGTLLYQSTLRVPLIFSGAPVAAAAGSRVHGSVSNAQLAATLSELLDVPADAMPASRLPSLLARDGTPLVPARDAAVYLETALPYYSFGWHGLRGLVEDGHKLIRGSRTELYSLADDPEERRNLAASRPELALDMGQRLDDFLARQPALDWAEGRGVDATDQQLLAELGYVAASGGAGDPFDPELPDPLERIADAPLYQQANRFLVEHHRLGAMPAPATAWQTTERRRAARAILEAARALYLLIQAKHPDDRRIPSHLGMVERELGNLPAAVSLLERAVAEQPAVAQHHYQLAVAYWQAGRTEEALAKAADAVLLERDPALYQSLVAWSLEVEDYGRAYGWLEAWERILEPESPDALRVRRQLEQVGAELRARDLRPVVPGASRVAPAIAR